MLPLPIISAITRKYPSNNPINWRVIGYNRVLIGINKHFLHLFSPPIIKEQEEEYGVNHVQRCWANHILLTMMPFKLRLPGPLYELYNTLQMPQHSQCKQHPSMDNETLNTSATKVWSYQHYPTHQAPLQLQYPTTKVWAQLLLHQNAEVPRPTSGYNITPLKRRQPDGVKCGFIGFSPRLNRALLMEATAYLCNFYHRSKPNVGFIVAFIQSAILLLSKADFVNGGHILSLCHW